MRIERQNHGLASKMMRKRIDLSKQTLMPYMNAVKISNRNDRVFPRTGNRMRTSKDFHDLMQKPVWLWQIFMGRVPRQKFKWYPTMSVLSIILEETLRSFSDNFLTVSQACSTNKKG